LKLKASLIKYKELLPTLSRIAAIPHKKSLNEDQSRPEFPVKIEQGTRGVFQLFDIDRNTARL